MDDFVTELKEYVNQIRVEIRTRTKSCVISHMIYDIYLILIHHFMNYKWYHNLMILIIHIIYEMIYELI